jgi:hypothetical protein
VLCGERAAAHREEQRERRRHVGVVEPSAHRAS